MKLLDRLRTPGKDVPTQSGPHLTFDRHSLIIDGKRVMIRGGAFHYFRLPAPELWKDRLLAIKRAGYNAVDLYFPWGYHSPANGVYDFTGIRDVDRLLALCTEVGLYVIARPGPYICAETDGGGHPIWVINDPDVHLRCLKGRTYVDSPKYRLYVRQWYEQIVPRIVCCPHLILFQIENEYINDTMNPSYMRYLANLARELGVKVPLIHNDLWKKGCWADIVDIYGVDDYAVASFGDDWRGKEGLLSGLDRLGEVREQYCKASPLAVLELQGGWFDPWTGIGYDEMRKRLGRENVNLATWTALAQGTSIYSHYMFVGGTNWDHVGAPCVHTSYDFAAPVYEWGGISDRYQAAKAIAHLVGAFEELFALAEPCNDVQASDPALVYAVRGHEEARLVFLRNLTGDVRSTTLRLGDVQTAPVPVAPWDMRVVLLNVPFAQARVTASNNIFTAMHHENQHLLVCYGAGTVTWKLPTPCRLLYTDTNAQVDGTQVKATYDGDGWKDVVFTSGGHRYRAFFAPTADELWLNGDYLLVGPSYSGDGQKKGGVTDLPRYTMRVQATGQAEKRLRVYSVTYMNRPEVNGEMVQASLDSMCGYLRFDLPRPPQVSLPALGPWRISSAMEPDELHLASGWRMLPQEHSLEMDKLGIYQGFAWYRAVYTGKMDDIGLAIRHNAAVYLNGRFVAKLDNYQSEATDEPPESETVQPERVRLPVALQRDGENVLTVLVESLGHNKGFLGNERLPRGILGVQTDRPLTWSVWAGVAGESDVTAPGFDDTDWTECADLSGLPREDLVWARTRFVLDLSQNVYAPMGLYLDGVADKAHIYLNGVLVGKDWSVCKHRTFYLPEGVLKTRGENVLAVLLWRRGGEAAAGTVELRTYTVQSSHEVSIL